MEVASIPRSSRPVFQFNALDVDGAFIALLDAYRATGGLLRGDLFGEHLGQGNRDLYLRLARKIASREVLSFRWNESIWLPMFQFEGTSLEIRLPVCEVLAELTGAMEGWDLAHWFVAPNMWLSGHSPLSLVFVEPVAVREAARADRFVCKG